MNISFMFTAILVQVLLRSLEAANTRVLSLPLEFGFEAKNLNKSTVFNHNKTVVCMLDSWSHWRSEGGTFTVSDIDPTLCSQLVYRNAGIDNSTFQVKLRDHHLVENLGWFRNIVSLSKAHPHLKVLLSIGGWTEGSFTFSKIAADYKKRSVFIDSVLRILQQYGFHGLDLAWEYPAWPNRGGIPQDKENLSLLVQELRNALGKEYLISLTAAGDTHFASPAYNIKALSNFVDQFNVRSFDFSGAWNKFAYHHSALKDAESRQSVVHTVNFYLENGAPPEKLVVGIPLYGRTFLLKDESTPQNNNEGVSNTSGLGQPTSGGFGGNWIDDTLLMGYHEICHKVSNRDEGKEWQTYWDNFCMVPFAKHNERWITFDNPESIEAKVTFVQMNKLKGVMAWTIDTDDFKGTACRKANSDSETGKEVTYPLLRAINYALIDIKVQSRSRSEQPGSTNGGGSTEYNNGNGNFGRNGGDNGKGPTSGCCMNLNFLMWSLFSLVVTMRLA